MTSLNLQETGQRPLLARPPTSSSTVFLRVGLARLAQHAEPVAALLAEALLAALSVVALADPHAAAAGRAVKLDVRGVDWHFLRKPATLRVLTAWLQVLVHPVDALDDDLAFARQHAKYAARG